MTSARGFSTYGSGTATKSAKKLITIWSSARGLRSLLPRYAGPTLTLYRGDGARNRRRRTYGLSWSTNRDTARGHATGYWRTFESEGVIRGYHLRPRAAGRLLRGGAVHGLSATLERKMLERFSQASIDAPRAKGASGVTIHSVCRGVSSGSCGTLQWARTDELLANFRGCIETTPGTH